MLDVVAREIVRFACPQTDVFDQANRRAIRCGNLSNAGTIPGDPKRALVAGTPRTFELNIDARDIESEAKYRRTYVILSLAAPRWQTFKLKYILRAAGGRGASYVRRARVATV